MIHEGHEETLRFLFGYFVNFLDEFFCERL